MIRKIITIRFPFAEREEAKIHPALCLTAPSTKHKDFIVAAITSNLARRASTDILVSELRPYFAETGLKTSSLIRLDKLATVHVSSIVALLGEFPKDLELTLVKNLRTVFAL